MNRLLPIIIAMISVMLSACATTNQDAAPTVDNQVQRNQGNTAATSAATMIRPVTSYF